MGLPGGDAGHVIAQAGLAQWRLLSPGPRVSALRRVTAVPGTNSQPDTAEKPFQNHTVCAQKNRQKISISKPRYSVLSIPKHQEAFTPGKLLPLVQRKKTAQNRQRGARHPELVQLTPLIPPPCVSRSILPRSFPAGLPAACALSAAAALCQDTYPARPVSREFPPIQAALTWRPAREISSGPAPPAASAKGARAFLSAGLRAAPAVRGEEDAPKAMLETRPAWLRLKRNRSLAFFSLS